MTTPTEELRQASEVLFARAQEYDAVTAGPYSGLPEPEGLTPLLAGARLRLAAKAYAAAMRAFTQEQTRIYQATQSASDAAHASESAGASDL